MGTIPQDGEWSIIGGTGEFVAAQGIVEHNVIQEAGGAWTYELKIHAFYTPMQSSGVSLINIIKLLPISIDVFVCT